MTQGSKMQKTANGNIELEITLPWAEVLKTYNHVVDEITESAELPGFRKGKAPREKVEESLDKTKTYEEVLRHLIPHIYADAVKEHNIKPIISPSITLKSAKEGEDWVVQAVTCEKPEVTLGEYKKEIRDLKKEKTQKIWVPGEDQKNPPAAGKGGQETEGENTKPTLDEILTKLLIVTTVIIPQVLLSQETTRLLSNLIDQTKKLGLTVEQYITSTNRTSEQLQKEYEEEAKKTITLELALEEIANKEGITVEEKDIDAMIETAKTPQEKEAMKNERYYIASLLRRQKTLQYLAEL